MDKKAERLLDIREFLHPESVDAMRVYLKRDEYGPGEVYFSGGIFFTETGQGHYCFETSDLEVLAEVAGRIQEQAARLRNACLAARPSVAHETWLQETWESLPDDVRQGAAAVLMGRQDE